MNPVIELFIKCSLFDKEEFGSCPINQTWFMAFYILVENKFINLRVTPVNMEMQPEGYLKLNVSRRLPVAKVESGFSPTGRDLTNLVAETTDDLEKLINIWRCPQLTLPTDDPEVGKAENLSADILKSLNILIKTKNDKPIVSILTKINSFLALKSTRFLITDDVTYADCILMPRLQHVRVAGREFASFDIPKHLKHLIGYIKSMYNEKVFEITCSRTRDIVLQHEEKINVPKSRRSYLIKDDNKLLTFDTEEDEKGNV